MQQQPNALRGPSQSGPSPGTATLGCGQGRGVLMRRAAPSVRARVLLGHAVEGDAALCRLRGPGQLGLPERAYGRCFFQLVLGGHRLEPLVLVQLSERYEQMEYLGRYIARKLNINYFDYLATSYRHVVRHWPPPSAGTLMRKNPAGHKPSSSQSNLEV
ncbi:transmembrane protein 249 isoform X5 [Trachypithecus francoisi]|uniref:transmembrane protein 249 isoform X5 n=1 Tax=Trachypithecus francoisi TaxID=54180 RepID=UPI00141B2D71|nr:transmembrane protein 249 isoform X5 [Trachypithecus francoisi]